MVHFKNKIQKLTFSNIGYQFPNTQDKEYDGNWLIIQIEISEQENYFQKTDPSLLTYELLAIADWLDGISNNQIPHNKMLNFIEPNLKFTLFSIEEGMVQLGIQVNFKLISDNEKYILHFEYSLAGIKQLSKELREEYNKYPIRM